uniref:Uncharacterized protein n=1 Tax=Oryza meridionalis TaxID=40149 RepID=A0A0E0D3E5_9ORYZ
MGLLDQLWDETVAGPRPDSGLGKLRKYSSFSPSSAAAAAGAAAPADAPVATVTRSITIVRPPSLSVPSPRGGGGGEYSSSVPSSPASAPGSPFASATTPKGDSWRRLRRKPKTATDATPEAAAAAAVGPRSPTVYDWFALFLFFLCKGGHQFVGPMNYSAIQQRGEKVQKNLKKRKEITNRAEEYL